MLDFFIKIKLFFLNALSNVLEILAKISRFFGFIFIDVFYSKILFNLVFFPLYKIYKKLVRDIVSQNNLQLNLMGRLFAVLFNKRIISVFVICFFSVWVFIDNITAYSIYDKELKLNNSIFFSLAGGSSKIDSVIVDNTVLSGKKDKNKNYLSVGDINKDLNTDFIPSDPEDYTYFSFDYSSVSKPSIMRYDSSLDSSVDGNKTEEDLRFASKTIYIVKSGDTLAGIARRFNINSDTILWENKMKSTDVLKVGAKLSILPFVGVGHKVVYGDTLLDLSIKYKISIDKIKQYNFIRGDVLRLGQSLIVPTSYIPKYSGTVASRPNTNNTKVTTKTNSLYPRVSQAEDDTDLVAHSFPYGQCTWYVATRRFVPWSGHAKSWLKNAQQYGYEIGKKPVVGAIVATKENALYGHVAYVEEVRDDVIVISEMNYKGWGIMNKREIPINDWRILGYIY